MKPLVNEMEAAPVAADKIRGGVGPQPLVEAGFELLIVTPSGRSSVIENAVRFVSAGAVMSICSMEFSPTLMLDGENDFVARISLPRKVTSAYAEYRFEIPTFVVRLPPEIRLVNVPEAVPGGTETGI